MIKEYGAKIDITEMARPFVYSLYDDFDYRLRYESDIDDIDRLLDTFPELEDDILEEVMRLITIDYCKKKVEESNPTGYTKIYELRCDDYKPLQFFLNKSEAEKHCSKAKDNFPNSTFSVKEHILKM